MIVKDGICYPDDMKPALSVVGCSVLDERHLRICFNSGDVRVVDVSPLFSIEALSPLGDPAVLRSFSIDHGILSWKDGELDIAPEWLFDHGKPERYPDIEFPPLSVAEPDPSPYS